MTQTLQLDGATRVLAIVGDPIAQVKSPAGVSAALQQQGRNAILVPSHVSPANLDAYVKGISLAGNLDGIIVTVPHKFAMFAQCSSTSDRARRLGAVNVMRRNADGSWHGDMCDGAGYVAAMRAAGCQPEGKRALLVGAGGAGSAIALALLENGVSELAIHDADTSRRDQLIARLSPASPASWPLAAMTPAALPLPSTPRPPACRPATRCRLMPAS
jgi:shikimate dehydrogenase